MIAQGLRKIGIYKMFVIITINFFFLRYKIWELLSNGLLVMCILFNLV